MSTGPTQTTNTNQNTSGSGTTQQSGSTSGTTDVTGTSNSTTANNSTGSTTGTSASGAWAPSLPMLTQQLSNIAPLQGVSPTNPTETTGIGDITQAADINQGINPTIIGDATNLASGGGFGTPTGTGNVASAYNTGAATLAPELAPSFTDPTQNPQVQAELASINNQVQNQVGGEFAGAGRGGPNVAQTGSPNGAYAGAVAKGLAAAETPVLTAEGNTLTGEQQAATNELMNLATGENTALNTTQGLANSAEAAAPGLLASDLAPGTTLLSTGEAAQNLPLQYEQGLNSTLLPIAQTGTTGQTSGTTQQQGGSTTTGNTTTDTIMNLLNSLTGSSTNTGTSAGTSVQQTQYSPLQTIIGGLALLSDPKAKDNIAPVGMLFDGTPVHRFNYKGSKKTQIGLMSPQVKARTPSAVMKGGDGLDRVNYDIATRPSLARAPMLAGVH